MAAALEALPGVRRVDVSRSRAGDAPGASARGGGLTWLMRRLREARRAAQAARGPSSPGAALSLSAEGGPASAPLQALLCEAPAPGVGGGLQLSMLGRVAALDSKGLAQVALALSGLLSLGEVAVSMEGGAGGSAQCNAAGPVIAQLAFLGARGADLPLLAVSSGTASSGFRPPFALEAMHSSVAWGKGRVANAPVLIELAVKGGGRRS